MEEKKEVWKAIKGYEGIYEVSNLGFVRSLNHYVVYSNGVRTLHKGKIFNNTANSKGYCRVSLSRNQKMDYRMMHRLVAEAFLPNPNNYPQINHKDENKMNNFVYINPDGTADIEKSNLEWCTAKYNINYGSCIERRRYGNAVKVICVETGKIYRSTVEAGLDVKTDRRMISRACGNIKYTAAGLHWKKYLP